MNIIELVCWEKAIHHPQEYISVLGHIPEQSTDNFPAVREVYWVESIEGYWCPSLEEVVEIDYWAYMPRGPHKRNKGGENK